MVPERKRWYEAAFGAHYPLLYRHRDQAEARRCLALLPRLAPLVGDDGGRLLDLGCGDGRHLQWLREDGIEAAGLDLSAELLAVAATRDSRRRIPLVRGDMRRIPFATGSFAGVLSLFTAFGYFGGPAAHGDVVHEIARIISPGGHWFLDYFDGSKVLAELGDGQEHVRERRLECLEVREARRYLADRSQVVKDVRLSAAPGHEQAAAALGVAAKGLSYREEVAVFTLDELDALAEKAGLRRVAEAGDYDGRPLGSGSRWILVYQRDGGSAS